MPGPTPTTTIITTNPWFVAVQGLLILGGIVWTHLRHEEDLRQTLPLVVIHIGLSILIRPMPAWIGAGLALIAVVYHYMTAFPGRLQRQRLPLYGFVLVIVVALVIFPQPNIMWAFLMVTSVGDWFERALSGKAIGGMLLAATPFVLAATLLSWGIGFFVLGVAIFRAIVAPVLNGIARRLVAPIPASS